MFNICKILIGFNTALVNCFDDDKAFTTFSIYFYLNDIPIATRYTEKRGQVLLYDFHFYVMLRQDIHRTNIQSLIQKGQAVFVLFDLGNNCLTYALGTTLQAHHFAALLVITEYHLF